MVNIKLLKETMTNTGMTVTAIAEKSDIVRGTLYKRLKSGEFKASEILALSIVLGLSKEKRDVIFFSDNSELKSLNSQHDSVNKYMYQERR